jgi:opine dehydrogenase
MQQVLSQRTGGVNGPATLDTRYVTEDVPFGLVPLLRLAAIVGAPVPLHESGIKIMSALYGRNFETENDILPQLGVLTREMLSDEGVS